MNLNLHRSGCLMVALMNAVAAPIQKNWNWKLLVSITVADCVVHFLQCVLILVNIFLCLLCICLKTLLLTENASIFSPG